MSIHSRTRLLTHLVWSTYKREWLKSRPLRIELNNYLREYADSHSIRLINAYVNPDHIHLLVDLDPKKYCQHSEIAKGHIFSMAKST